MEFDVNSAHSTSDVSRPNSFSMRRFFVPALSEWVFLSLLIWLFVLVPSGAQGLLADGDTGLHIRTGDFILDNGHLPVTEPFSFTMADKVWFAWEWLAALVFAGVHRAGGLAGIALLGGVVIAGTAAALFRYMLWMRVNVLLAVAAMLAVCSASTIHWLARPHMFSWGLFLATWWLLEADWSKSTRWVWALVPLEIVWTNLHGAWPAMLICIAVYAAAAAIDHLKDHFEAGTLANSYWPWSPKMRRYAVLGIACATATLCNPYGYHLHEHIGSYLQSDFILKYVQEFQSPNFRGESMLVYEVALLGTMILVAQLIRRGEWRFALLAGAWAHASLLSVRHVPLFMIVAGPLVAREVSMWIGEAARRGNPWARGLQELADDYAPKSSESETGPAIGWLTFAAAAGIAWSLSANAHTEQWKAEFPEVRFPAVACNELEDRFRDKVLLAPDQWGDYLIYRYYGEDPVKVYIDGRSDFYAADIGDDYITLLQAGWRWDEVIEANRFEAALLPVEWALTSVLKLDPRWEVVYDDGFAVYFERQKTPATEQPADGSEGGEKSDIAAAKARVNRVLVHAVPDECFLRKGFCLQLDRAGLGANRWVPSIPPWAPLGVPI